MNFKQFKISSFQLFALFILLFSISSCSDTVQEKNQSSDQITSMQDFLDELDKNPRQTKYKQVDDFSGKTVADFYNEWSRENEHISRTDICGAPPSGCDAQLDQTMNITLGSCVFECTFDIYDCGFGNVGIYNFEFTPVSGFCGWYEFLVEDNFNDGDLVQYQQNYNIIAAIILSQIEDALIPTIDTPTGAIVFFTYVPNICSAVCLSNGFREQCGEDCCLRFSVFQFGERSADVFSYGLCGGTTYTCNTNGSESPCETTNCQNLNTYR